MSPNSTGWLAVEINLLDSSETACNCNLCSFFVLSLKNMYSTGSMYVKIDIGCIMSGQETMKTSEREHPFDSFFIWTCIAKKDEYMCTFSQCISFMFWGVNERCGNEP